MKRLLTLLLCLSLAGLLKAQVFMRPFDNAAAMGMGGAVVSMPNTNSGLSNDAQLGLGEKMAFMAGSALPYSLAGWQSAQFQAMASLGKTSGIGLSVFHSSADIYLEQRFQLAYGRRLGDKFHLGASFDVMRNDAAEYGAQTQPGFSISLLAQALPQVWIGAKYQNPLQQKFGEDLSPTIFRIGATWKPSDQFLCSLETEKDLERPTQVKAGVEYRPGTLLALRAGARTGKAARMNFGAGFRLKNGLSIDIGSEWHPTLGITPALMVAWRK